MTRERCSCGASVEVDKGDQMYAATLESMHVTEWRKKHRCNADSKLIGLLKEALPEIERVKETHEYMYRLLAVLAGDIRGELEEKRCVR